MTAEVVVLNSFGTALAADSALTLDSRKVVVGGDKIFLISEHAPLAAMTYGDASLCGVPWETLFTLFRRNQCEIASPEPCVDDFLCFLMAKDGPITRQRQEAWLFSCVGDQFRAIATKARDELAESRRSKDPTRAQDVVGRAIAGIRAAWEGVEYGEGLDADHERQVKKVYSEAIRDLIGRYFKPGLTSSEAVNDLVEREFFPALHEERRAELLVNEPQREGHELARESLEHMFDSQG